MPGISPAASEAENMTAQTQTTPLVILRRPVVEARIGLSKSAIYARIKPNPNRPNDYDPTFPLPVNLGGKAVGWVEAEIDAWLNAQLEKRGKV